MREISTLIYLVDDINLPPDTFLHQNHEDIQLVDEQCIQLLNLIAIDPGEDLVLAIMEQMEE
ncbi:MAG: hypothetical protein WD577_02090 [Bacteroidales bacterium]